MSNYRQGSSFENEVAARLTRCGFFVTRAAGSGTADRAQADLVAIRDDRIVIVECKTYRSDSDEHIVEYDEEQLEDIRAMCKDDIELNTDRRATDIIVAMKNKNGGIAQYCVATDGRALIDEDTLPLYEYVNEIDRNDGDCDNE